MKRIVSEHEWISQREDLLAGRWLREDGTCYCEWQWNADTGALNVSAEGIEDEINFDLDDYVLKLNGLAKSLPEISRHHVDRRRSSRPKQQIL
ncbi:MAG: hypothetical protein AB8C02_05845 [Halioglobus sp.]